MSRIIDIKLPIENNANIFDYAKKKRLVHSEEVFQRILKRSIDARRKDSIHFLYRLEVSENTFPPSDFSLKVPRIFHNIRPIIIGFGVSGMFAALEFLKNGYVPIIFERGSEVEKRQNDIVDFFKNANLNPQSNIQYGEGGAGTFSDGKLNTNCNGESNKIVLETFAHFGAPSEILYESKPHIGTDYLVKIVKNIRDFLKINGVDFNFNCQVKDIILDEKKIVGIIDENGKTWQSEIIVLAIGNSSRDTYRMLYKKSVALKPKSFSVGVRIEHLQSDINRMQYGYQTDLSKLPPADYKLSTHLSSGRCLYTFCMCPGGVVVASSSAENSIVTNGMSDFSRDKTNANSALLVNVNVEDYGNCPMKAIAFQEDLEKKAFDCTNSYRAPAQKLGDFLNNNLSKGFDKVTPSYPLGIISCNLRNLLPNFVTDSIAEGILEFDKKMKGFADPDAVLTGFETRSSAPLTIERDRQSFQSINIDGLYPIGEGAGYAGGIMSAAVDGIKATRAIIKKFQICSLE